MSVEAITWALGLKVDRSSAKFVLVAMANCANNDMTCWPSIKYLSEATCQNRKTVLENMKRLKEAGFIQPLEVKKGRTYQVPVYLLNGPGIGSVSCVETDPKTDINRPKNGTVCDGNRPENGHEQARKRTETGPKTDNTSPESGTVHEDETGPKTDGNRPENGHKQARKRTETGPKTGPGTVKNRNEPSGNPNKRASAPSIVLLDWVPNEAWSGFLAMRKKIKKPITDEAIPIALRKLDSLRLAGNDPTAVLEQSTMSCWQGLFEVKQGLARVNAPHGASQLGKAGQATAAAAKKWLEESNGND